MEYPIAERYIYGLKGLDELFYYVGITKDPKRRECEYLLYPTKVHACIYEWYNDLAQPPKFVILQRLATFVDEQRWIARLRKDGHPLLNIGWTDQRKAKHSQVMLNGRAKAQGSLSRGNKLPRLGSAKKFQTYWSSLTEEQRKEIFKRRAQTLRDTLAIKRRLSRGL